ncbi:MAG: glycosyl hydrolase family 28-related protein [Tepidisphaeraceae bacterium]
MTGVARAQTSELWGRNGEKWSPTSRLPDYSFAGYHCGDRPIPDVPAATDATKFGATPDDDTDDAPAIQKAIDATEKGAVTLPAGRFVLGGEVFIKKGNVVLRGAGRGRTILVIPRSLEQLQGERITEVTKSSYSFTGGFVTVRGADNGKKLADVTEPAQRGDNTLVVADVSRIKPGAWIRFTMNNDDALGRLLHGGLAVGEATPREKKLYVDWCARVTAVDGSRVTIDRPLRVEVRTAWEPQLRSYEPTVQEVGIEQLTFEFPGKPPRPHLKEEGFNAILMAGVANCWVRDVAFVEADNGINVTGASRFCTFNDLSFIAPKRDAIVAQIAATNPTTRPTPRTTGHHAMWVRGTQDCLFRDFTIDTQYVHDLTVEGIATGTVFAKGRAVAMNFDHHRNLPYDNLFTDLDAGDASRLWKSGGSTNRGPHGGVGETFWNIRWSKGGPPKPPPFPRANVIGIRGMSKATDAADGVWVEPIESIEPENLYEAQLRMRLAQQH